VKKIFSISYIKLFAVFLVMLALVGCSTFAKPRSMGDSIAYAYGSLAAVRTTATQLLQRNRITLADAEKVQTGANQVRAELDLAASFYDKNDLSTAQSRLDFALKLLIELEALLNQNNRSVSNGTNSNSIKRSDSGRRFVGRDHDPGHAIEPGQRANYTSAIRGPVGIYGRRMAAHPVFG